MEVTMLVLLVGAFHAKPKWVKISKILTAYARQFKTWRILPFIKKKKKMSEIRPKIMIKKP